ncbi:MAG: hypothetical protein Q9166_006283 [cf. Caloplaca sp. 2 TL-2023]
MFDAVLPLFPGLQLETLWVGDPYHGKWSMEDGWGHNAAYHAVEDLIESQGFKEVTYVVEHDRFMRPVSFTTSNGYQPGVQGTETTPREPQPSTWDAMIKKRDGAESGAKVQMFRLLDNGNRRIPLNTEFESVQEASDKEADGQIEIKIQRGRNADYVQTGKPRQKYDKELADLFHKITWKGILEKELYIDAEDDPTAHL